MVRKAPTGEQLLRQALKNGAVIEGEVPKKMQPRAPKPRREGEYTNRLNDAAALGWEWIETEDALRYRWRTAAGAASAWGTYEEITRISVGPA